MVYYYKVRYFISAQLKKARRQLFRWEIKLENRNSWNEYNENFRS
jgi:hypothetical protein